MKNKISSIIMTLVSILIIVILIILGIILYKYVTETDIVDTVQDFASNLIITGTSETENIETPGIIESVSNSINSSDSNVNYNNIQINKYFYEQLSNESKTIYRSLESNKENMKTGTYEVDFGTNFSDLLSTNGGDKLLGEYYQSAIEAYTYDNPDVFYLDVGKMYLNIETTTKGRKVTYRVFINSGNSASYLSSEFSTKQQIDSALKEVEQVRNYFIQNKKSDTYSNIKMVHDYLINNIEYEQNSSEAYVYNIYGALVNKKCVCEGYAKAFKYLMDALDIQTTLVSGKGTNSEGNTENHAWNYVQLDEKWYAIDCTWDDPIIIGGGTLSNSSKYKYFLKGENEFNQTHIPEGQFTQGGKIFIYPTLSVNNYQ